MQTHDFKIIDCFTFFNELDLLRLRIKILEHHVDHFAIVEARQTFTGLPKDIVLNQNLAPDIVNHPKVVIKTVDLPGNCSNWEREDFQRESIHDIVNQLSTKANDIILLSDVDEIPSTNALSRAIDELQKSRDRTLCILEQRLFYFRLNYELVYSHKLPWLGTTAIKSKHCTSLGCMRATGRNLRGRKHRRYFDRQLTRKQLPNGGWHFSYLGEDDSLKKKFQSFSHQEDNVQAAKATNIRDLISTRGSLFPREANHEIWAVIPLEDVGLPDFTVADLFESPLVEAGPRTPASVIIQDLLLKSKSSGLAIGDYEISIGIRRRLRQAKCPSMTALKSEKNCE